MSRKLDVARMEAAFKRAAHKAVYGTREERSGRFMLKEKRQSAAGSDRDTSTGARVAKRKA
jgi:hypothetical protein